FKTGTIQISDTKLKLNLIIIHSKSIEVQTEREHASRNNYSYTGSNEFDSQASSKDNSEVEQESQGPLNPYIMHKISKTEKSKFNYLLLKMTISNG
ncbi:14199_t:CDS:2, partial [Cetraspora pellucida]